jgi:hypothetical protein
VGQFRLAYVAGSAADSGYLLTLTLYWAPVASLMTQEIDRVEEVENGAQCRYASHGWAYTSLCAVYTS